jgi:hypothetical protein
MGRPNPRYAAVCELVAGRAAHTVQPITDWQGKWQEAHG